MTTAILLFLTLGSKGNKSPTQNGGHLRMNVIGMVCPRTGQFFAIEASHYRELK
jgi:hypothetical protein